MSANGKQTNETPDGRSGSELAAPSRSVLEPAESAAAGPRAADDDQSTALTFALIRRSKWTILAVALSLSAIALPVIWLTQEPAYMATASVHVAPVVSRLVYKTEDNVGGMQSLYHSYLNTQMSIIRSTPVLERVLDDPAVQGTDWYKNPPETLKMHLGGAAPTYLERLTDALTVEQEAYGEMINVSATDRSAADATTIVNVLVDEYKKYMDEALRKTDVQRFETLNLERSALRKEIDGLLASKFNLAKRLGTIAPEDLRSQLAMQLSELEAKREELKHAYSMTRWELQYHPVPESESPKDAMPGAREEPDADEWYAADSDWRVLSRGLEDARHELDLALSRYGSSHPRVRELQSEVEYAEKQLRTRESQLDALRDRATRAVDVAPQDPATLHDRVSLEVLAQRQQHELELLDEQIKRQQDRVAEAGDIAREIAQLEEEINHKREAYAAVRSRLEALELESKAPARISIAATAMAPTRPHRDRRPTLSVMAIAGAFFVGVAVAFMRNRLNPKIYEASDVRYAIHVPFLGQVPYDPSHRHGWNDADATAMECIRMIRTALLERMRGAGSRVVLITSSNSRAGKTSVTLALARSLADLGKKTLLVEADLRRPTLQDRLGMKANAGLAALLTQKKDESEVMLRTDDRKPDIVLAGKLPEGFDPELLANGIFASCLERWRETYDFILLDSPPVLPVADARILARQVDGTVMVLRASHCRRTEVLQAQADLNAVGCRLLGTVLVGGAGASQYGYGAEYGSTSGDLKALVAKAQPQEDE